jgi:hypothetical protein
LEIKNYAVFVLWDVWHSVLKWQVQAGANSLLSSACLHKMMLLHYRVSQSVEVACFMPPTSSQILLPCVSVSNSDPNTKVSEATIIG